MTSIRLLVACIYPHISFKGLMDDVVELQKYPLLLFVEEVKWMISCSIPKLDSLVHPLAASKISSIPTPKKASL